MFHKYLTSLIYGVVLSLPTSSNATEISCGPCSQGICDVMAIASSNPDHQTDKTTFHTYQQMYGIHLAPLRHRSSSLKLFEIGLGCNMAYGPGASVQLWQALLPGVELWTAEYDAACVRRHAGRLARYPGLHVVTGDQGNASTVREWISASGGNFDVVIDDGSHRNGDILTSFSLLWPNVRPGGLYFLEDLEVGRDVAIQAGQAAVDAPVVSDVLAHWMQSLIFADRGDGVMGAAGSGTAAGSRIPPLPENVASIYCQREACVLAKTCDGKSRGSGEC